MRPAAAGEIDCPRVTMARRTGFESTTSRLAHHVTATVREARLFSPGDHLLVCVSGGPDSVCLLAVLKELTSFWGLRLSVAHINHGLRGGESEEDAVFVARLCEEMRLPCFCESVNLKRAQSAPAGTLRSSVTSSMQGRAREARYAALRAIASRAGADKIAMGHTAGDQAETLLLWMLRGAGTTGLAGIPQMRDGIWIRPLLGVTRADVLAYLEEQGLGFRMDSSNAKPIYQRNRVRLELLPILLKLNPGIVRVLGRQSRILREEDRCLDQIATEQVGRLARQGADGQVMVDRTGLVALPPAVQRRVVRAVVRKVTGSQQGPAFGAVEALLDRVVQGRSGTALRVAGTTAWRDYSVIRFQVVHETPAGIEEKDRGSRATTTSVSLESPVTLPWPWTRQVIRLTLVEKPLGVSPELGPEPRMRAALDADRFSMPVTVRSWLPGDWFQPAGMQGRRKKLQDYFSDVKLPRRDRSRIPILVASEGILWVCGQRMDHRFRATAETRRVLVADLQEAEPEREIV